MRQVGILAAAGLEALEMRHRLNEDHDNARYFGEELHKLPGISVRLNEIKINMIFFTIDKEGFQESDLVAHMKEHGILMNGSDEGVFRFVTHYYVTRERINQVLQILREYFQ